MYDKVRLILFWIYEDLLSLYFIYLDLQIYKNLILDRVVFFEEYRCM